MMIERLKEVGVTSDMAYTATLISIALSIGIWYAKRDEDQAHAERFGIFVGLWAPTFAAIGNALKTEEQSVRLEKKV
jgi:hypothetical protein